MSFRTIIHKYRTLSFSKADQGNRFERLMKNFLLSAPVYKGERIQIVWLWNEFPSKTDFGTGHDTGIDLVARTETGEYWAIQCKCYDENTQIDKAAVDTFISTSARSFNDVTEYGKIVHFSRRIWLDTSGKGFSQNAEDTLKNQNPPVSRMGFYELACADVYWDKLDTGCFGEAAETAKYAPRPHQQTAIDRTHEYFQNHDRGKLIMACGTGKTFTSLKIAEKETLSNSTPPRILFLAPSIALVGQTLKEWSAQADRPIHGLCICSDPKVSQKVADDDEIGESIINLALPASTSFTEIEKQVKQAQLKQKQDGGMLVVFSTYQSIDVVHEVQQQFQDGLVFDLCVCDEAHRTTGVQRKDEDTSAFVRIHDMEYIKARKRLYMTATPRLYSDKEQKKASDAEAVVWSMDDPATYGDEIYRIGFGEAVKLGLLSDYKVLVLTLNEDEMSAALQQEIAQEDSEIPTDDSLKLIGCINALSKITKDTALLNEVDPGLMHNAIAFCQNIKISKKTVQMMETCRDAYYNTLNEQERSRIVSISADHVDGSMGATERSRKLQWLKDVDRESNKCNVLMNVRCLSEGVDVPSLDAVLFLSARNSQIDVVQSVGRVMRKAAGKRYGYIIIPVVIPSNIEPEKALDDNKRFAVVWTVLQALRAHDDRFNAIINKIELNKKRPSQILVGGAASIHEDGGSDNGMEAAFRKEEEKQLLMKFGEIQNAVYSKLVKKVGDRRYWEQWASDVAQIAERHIAQIKKLIAVEGSQAQKAFDKYLKGLRKNINPSVTVDDAVEMLAQHFITQPVFEALFEGYSFVQNNAMSKSMQGMVKILNEQTPKEDNEKLERFYESVRERAKDIDNAEGKQKVIIELYDKFFKTAFPKTVEKLGIVYTPVKVVDFIINSVEDVMRQEFGRSLSDENVHILDPFTGTGTFIVRLLQSEIIKPVDMARKYKNELHACEIVLLAYYIASINIENTYHGFLAEQIRKKNQSEKTKIHDYGYEVQNVAESEPAYEAKVAYKPFEGICLTDTFQMGEDNNELLEEVFPQNSKRVNKLKKTPITVIIGNPPYSIGQKSVSDNAENEHYPNLENQIEKQYVKESTANLHKAVYDSYIKAFRWSTDRIGDNNGIIGFVSNAGWLDGNAMDGMRKCFEREFSNIYIFSLRGNCRTSGELRRKEGGNVFGLGSRTPIAITILVKRKGFKGKAKIMYKAVDDYLTREDKLKLCAEYRSVLDKKFKTTLLSPDEYGGWIRKKKEKFEIFIPLQPEKKGLGNNSFFDMISLGISSNRDAWVYNSSIEALTNNMQKTIAYYNDICELWSSEHNESFDHFIENKKDRTNIAWTDTLTRDATAGRKYEFDSSCIVCSSYRPFFYQNFYYSKQWNHRQYTQQKIFPSVIRKKDNLVVCVSGIGGSKPFCSHISDFIPSLDYLEKTQCFPLYWYEEIKLDQHDLFSGETSQYIKHDGITDFILDQAQKKYGPRVTKEDIFYYVYGILHSKSYIEKFADDLKMQLPRLPLVTEPQKFWDFSKAGRELAELHLNYEKVSAYPDIVVEGARGDYTVTKMRYPKKGEIDTIIYNDDITIRNIPAKAYEYVINGKSAIAWIMERYQDKTDKDSQIRNNPNDWGIEHGNPRYILDLLLSIINVSCQTVDIVNNLPEVDWDTE